MKKRWALLVWGTWQLVAVPACVYDDDERCGPHQVEISNNRCECSPGYVPGVSGCVPCGEYEEERAGECVCVAGYARASEAAACEPLPDDLGSSCDAENPCASEAYPECHLTEDGSGYCTTTGCTSSDDCSGGYKCQKESDGSFCRRPALGYGKSCKTQADCADGEATFCETLQTNLCIVPCTAETTSVCFEGEVCCDFSLFNAGTVCTPAASCTAPGVNLGGPGAP